MRQVILDSRHVSALVHSPMFSQLFPGVVPQRIPRTSCCGGQQEAYQDIKSMLLSMSEQQARRVAAALGIPPGTQMVVRLVTRSRVDSRTYLV